WVAALAAIAFSLAVAAFAVSRSYPVSLLLLGVAGATNTLSSIACSSGIQQRTPDSMQGRVMGVYQVTWEMQVIGALTVGALADATGAPFALALAGLASAGVIAALVAMRPVTLVPALLRSR
ncbi:MAG: hypothetical protein ACRDJE_01345, partial [Dehalococcoidia bacterium]